MQKKTISPEDLVCMNAQLWLHKDMAEIVFQAAQYCFNHYNIGYILYDGLRTSNAQAAMMKTQRVLDNPHWLEEPMLLSSPGSGGHPRGMAIDIGLEDSDGNLLDMGTAFDYLAENPHADHNPAHRDYKHPAHIVENRTILDHTMAYAAEIVGRPILPLPQEWWDFRFSHDIYEHYAPLSDQNLPHHMRLL